MISNDNQISLTYLLGGEYLVKAGCYNGDKTIERNILSRASIKIILSTQFTEMCLTKPKPPKDHNINRRLRSTQGNLFQNWKKLSVEERVQKQVEIYVDDMDGELIDYTII